jgi:hypothetical protein
MNKTTLLIDHLHDGHLLDVVALRRQQALQPIHPLLELLVQADERSEALLGVALEHHPLHAQAFQLFVLLRLRRRGRTQGLA